MALSVMGNIGATQQEGMGRLAMLMQKRRKPPSPTAQSGQPQTLQTAYSGQEPQTAVQGQQEGAGILPQPTPAPAPGGIPQQKRRRGLLRPQTGLGMPSGLGSV